MVKEELLQVFTIETLHSRIYGRCTVDKTRTLGRGRDLVIGACYFPPDSSSRGSNSEETLLKLEEPVHKFSTLGTVMMSGNYNAKCGSLREENDALPARVELDQVKNHQGEVLMKFCLDSSGLCIVNGRVGKDGFTCVSGRGSSVVDYCLLPAEELDIIEKLRIVTMTDCQQEMKMEGEAERKPDHSILLWELKGDG